MIDKILKKFVMLNMANGNVLEGFVDSCEKGFLEVRETDNNTLYVRVEDISFVRIIVGGQSAQRPSYPNEQEEEEVAVHLPKTILKTPPRPAVVKGDYSMPMPTKEDFEVPYKAPDFIRKTRKDENINEED
jgi:hypothetical protein